MSANDRQIADALVYWAVNDYEPSTHGLDASFSHVSSITCAWGSLLRSHPALGPIS